MFWRSREDSADIRKPLAVSSLCVILIRWGKIGKGRTSYSHVKEEGKKKRFIIKKTRGKNIWWSRIIIERSHKRLKMKRAS